MWQPSSNISGDGTPNDRWLYRKVMNIIVSGVDGRGNKDKEK
jgi:hypothetical protein